MGQATWPTEFLGDERDLLAAFVELLGAQRFFAVAAENRLDALYRESVTAQQEVTKTLGRQVRQAVELLVNAISRADRAEGNRLLAGVEPREVYEAAVTVLMRIVFLLYAEERRLLPLDDPVYNANYAILPMRERLEERARLSDEALSFGHAAWAQVLATSRAVYGGIQHERLRLPPYGGSLFDPDRYPFLEGRAATSEWHETESNPIPVDDRTMLAVLGALQQLKVKGELRSLSFRQLAVEQIGHVYEGLLDHGCVRAGEVVVGLQGKEGFEPELPLSRLEEALGRGLDALVELVVEASKLTRNKVQSLVLVVPSAEDLGALSAACGHDDELTARVRPFLPLLRRDLNGLPMVFPPGSMYVTQTGQRRDSGTAYTTPELADEVVLYALEPQVYSPGPAQTADRSEWRLKSSAEILDLKVCDPAVGSGAILVAAVRYLAERLVEAWRAEIEDGTPVRLLDGVPEDDWELIARRAVVDHCIYGVDRNPMAVEMAKLSLWLTTMAHDRPFTFLDHQLRSGDSLLGITDLDQLRLFHPDPTSADARQHRVLRPEGGDRATGRARARLRREIDGDRRADAPRRRSQARPPAASSRRRSRRSQRSRTPCPARCSRARGRPGTLDGRLRALGERVPRRSLRSGDLADARRGRAAAARHRPARGRALAAAAALAARVSGGVHARGRRVRRDRRQPTVPRRPADLGRMLVRQSASISSERLLAMREEARILSPSSSSEPRHFSGRTERSVFWPQTRSRRATPARWDSIGCSANKAPRCTEPSVAAWPGAESLEVSMIWLDAWLVGGLTVLDGRVVTRIDSALNPGSRVQGNPRRLSGYSEVTFNGSIVLGMGFDDSRKTRHLSCYGPIRATRMWCCRT